MPPGIRNGFFASNSSCAAEEKTIEGCARGASAEKGVSQRALRHGGSRERNVKTKRADTAATRLRYRWDHYHPVSQIGISEKERQSRG